MLWIQSGCVSGTLVGHDLCDEQDQAAEIVSHLRLKTTTTSTTGIVGGATTTITHPKRYMQLVWIVGSLLQSQDLLPCPRTSGQT
jgi:hypothetical protein